MLKPQRRGSLRKLDARIAIVASRYNARYVEGMSAAALEILKAAGVQVELFHVPGAFEIPVAAAALAHRTEHRPDAVIGLGLIWQGETSHAEHIGSAVTNGLMSLAITSGIPMIHEILTVSTAEQAEVRCIHPKTNRGTEAARTAIETIRAIRSVKNLEPLRVAMCGVEDSTGFFLRSFSAFTG
jgi:6,7-dimethyl-8-ribityllumazine synthase